MEKRCALHVFGGVYAFTYHMKLKMEIDDDFDTIQMFENTILFHLICDVYSLRFVFRFFFTAENLKIRIDCYCVFQLNHMKCLAISRQFQFNSIRS